MKPKKKLRIVLMLTPEINQLLDDLAEKEQRTRSTIVERALQKYSTETTE